MLCKPSEEKKPPRLDIYAPQVKGDFSTLLLSVDKVLSHVNSYSRPALNDRSPFDLFAFTYGEAILAKLGIRRVPANEIVLKPSLLGR